jgi:hypothetical protein
MSRVLFKCNGRVYRAQGNPTRPTIIFGSIEISKPPAELLAAAKMALEDDVVVVVEER